MKTWTKQLTGSKELDICHKVVTRLSKAENSSLPGSNNVGGTMQSFIRSQRVFMKSEKSGLIKGHDPTHLRISTVHSLYCILKHCMLPASINQHV